MNPPNDKQGKELSEETMNKVVGGFGSIEHTTPLVSTDGEFGEVPGTTVRDAGETRPSYPNPLDNLLP